MGGSSGGGGGGGNSVYTVRYAPYVEAKHSVFLDSTQWWRCWAIDNNPYNNFTLIPIDEGFFGIGYILASFPALFDVYGKFIAGLDIESLWEELLESTQTSAAVGNMVAAESALMDEELDTSVFPKFMTGMRDLNACMSSTFVIGKALIVNSKQKAINKFSAELKWKLISVAEDRWKAHLAWNHEVVNSYSNLFGRYFATKEAITRLNYDYIGKRVAWPMEMLDHERANLGALQGAVKQTSSTDTGGGSKAAGVAGGVMGGAAIGASVGGPWGAAIGGVIGGIASLL